MGVEDPLPVEHSRSEIIVRGATNTIALYHGLRMGDDFLGRGVWR